MRVLLTFFLFIIHFASQAQEQENRETAPEQRIQTSRIFGKIVDNNKKGVEAVSVQLYLVRTNNTDSALAGTLTKPNGDFSFHEISLNQQLKIRISGIGYEEKEIELPADKNAVSQKDLGNIEIEQEFKALDNVVVSAARPSLQMGIDRKVFSVAGSITSTGGSAVDVMRNIPSLNVDIDGNVELRNSSPQIFIDGLPTILTLEQIPADNIERVELITNPSAKYDASSSGGIINIILKKNKRIGLNGVVSAGAGHPGIINSNLNLNLREGKFNFFLNGGFNRNGGIAKGKTFRENKRGGQITDYFNQNTENERNSRNGSVRFGFDYFINNRNSITLTQGFNPDKGSRVETQRQEQLDLHQQLVYNGVRVADNNNKYNGSESRISYKHDFPQTGRELTASVNYNRGKFSNSSFINNQYFNPDGTAYRPDSRVENFGSGKDYRITAQIDYTHPIGEEGKFEAGLRSYYNSTQSIYDAFSIDNNTGTPTKLSLSNNYEYTEKVNAAYINYGSKIGTWGYQAGFRTEFSDFNGLLVDSAYRFGYKYPRKLKNIWDALFPSLFLTKELGDNDELQINYSRKISRPRFWNLNPFVEINDPVNLRQGNLELQPEFTNSFELNYNHKYAKGNILTVLYWHNNPNDITQYSDTISAAKYEELAGAGVDPNAILNTWINAGVTNRYGAEITLQHKFSEQLEVVPNFDLQYRKVSAKVGDMDLSNEGFNWETKVTVNYKVAAAEKSVFNKLAIQAMGEYESATVLAQGKRKPRYRMDLALRKDFLAKDKGTITFSVNDVFDTHRFGTIYDTDSFYQDSYSRWRVRGFRLTFTYRFGSADFSLLGKGNRNNDDFE